ncbi:hypothetical protein Tsubulata_017420 [Turnera subulata]|uniref:DUF3444 domain-containing protein n=1 Tax=Turnera subulata TaxID=218843 RepID=A0A9Q0FVQ1_9ROSI|nr:hypothetical protein Tsubulata_017420 [Turnera subulata]
MMVQALKEKEIAEQMITREDYASARARLLKAQRLYPAMDVVDALLAVCDILSAASIELPGCGVDHYWVLQVIPSSTFLDIQSRYYKLDSLLQPIRKFYPCTELALTLLRNALAVLVDKKRRSEFDSKRDTSWENYKSFDIASSYPTDLQLTIQEKNVCSHSKDTRLGKAAHDFYNFEKDRSSEHFVAGQIWAVNHKADLSHTHRYARIDSSSKAVTCVSWLKPIPVTCGERRWCDAGLPVACGGFEVSLDMKMRIEVSWPMISSYRSSWAHGVTEEQFEIYPQKGDVWAVYSDWSLDDWSYNPDLAKNCKVDLVEILSDFSKYMDIEVAHLVKVNCFTCIFEREEIKHRIPADNLYRFSHKIPAYRFQGGELEMVVEGMLELDQQALPDYMIEDIGTCILTDFTSGEQLPSFKSCSEDTILMSSSSPHHFAPGQVWAVYFGKDCMPRQYVSISNVISENQVCVTFLEPLPFLDHEIEWLGQGLPITCGIFKVSGRRANIEMPMFAYQVECQSSSNSCYKIYPQKGEIWATYKGWNTSWRMSDYENYQCLIVHILSNISEEDGIRISVLEEVTGCLTFFQKKQFNGFDLTHAVSGTDMLSFSHRIPAFRVPGIGKLGIPENSWHLEPNALPLPSS